MSEKTTEYNIEAELRALLAAIRGYAPNADLSRVTRAFEVASAAHGQQHRAGGEPFITHPVHVAQILAEMELDMDSIVAGLLHDVVEDTSITYEDIRRQFGAQVASLVDGVTKLGRIPYSSKEEQQIENLRKMFLAMANDVRVILIKLADRLHNMRTIASMPEKKQREKALETMEVYSPLAHRLGISKIKSELEDISIRYLDPIGYREIVTELEKKRAENKDFIQSIMDKMAERLQQQGIKASISGREKHIYSIYRKIFGQNRSMDELYDLYAIRLIVDNVIDCYNVLGVVHDMYKPIPGRFKDYISTPKPNMYQSLHTTVIGKEGIPFEIQIRTWEMHQTAEFGIAAHWKYKSGVKGDEGQDAKLAWIRQLLEIQRDAEDPDDFMRALKIDMFADEVFVFTPKGDVINLPLGSTIIDFAYAIHSAVGNRMTGGKVNGRIVQLDYILKNGDIVEILTTGGGHGPTMDWLKMAKTSEARNKIRQWFKKEKREENVAIGKEELEKELKRNNITMEQFTRKEILAAVFKRTHVNTEEDLYAGIGYGGISIHKVIVAVSNELLKLSKSLEKKMLTDSEVLEKQHSEPPKHAKKSASGVIIDGQDNMLIKFAHCCNPLPGDEIIGYITKGYGVSVHKRDCTNVINGLTRAGDSNRWIPVHWAGSVSNTFTSVLHIVSRGRIGLLADVCNVISDMRLDILNINARETKDNFAICYVTLEIDNLEQLGAVMSRLSKIDGIISVTRSSQ